MLRFGIFEANPAAGELWKDGRRIKLQDQPFQVLTTLLERSGQVVTREELREKLWGADTFVDFDRSLNKAINRLREALDDSAESPRYIETVPKRGYRFIAPVEQDVASEESAHSDERPPNRRTEARRGQKVAYAVAGLCIVAAVLVLWSRPANKVEFGPLLRTSLLPPPESSFLPNGFAISPDGTRLAFVAVDRDGKSVLWIRALTGNGAQRLEGTGNATFPFWSADNRHIGFFADRKLKSIDVTAGGVRVLCDAPAGRGGTWNREGTIVFAPSVAGALLRVNASGGETARVTTIRSQTQSHSLPAFLPDGIHFLFYVFRSEQNDVLSNGVYIGALGSPDAKLLSADLAGNVTYSSGHLLYVRDRSLVAQPFDDRRLRFAGPAMSMAEQELDPDRTFRRAGFSVSNNGVVVFQSTADYPAQLVWFDASGRELGPISDAAYRDPSFSPDGRYLAVASDDGRNGKYSIRIYDLARGVDLRLTEPADASRPTWSPDGSEITYAATEGQVSYLYRVRADGSGAPQVLRKGTFMVPTHWSPDGELVFFVVENGLPFLKIHAKDGSVRPFGPGAEAQVSPDGRWIAYIGQGGVAGGGGIIVQPFVGEGQHVQISGPGSAQPRWSRDGRRIFYMAPDRKLMSVSFDPQKGSAGEAHLVFQTRIIAPNFASFQYDVAADGRFLINSLPSNHAAPLTVITGWQGSR